MENVKLSLKVQNGDKVKRLLEKAYSSLAELKAIIEGSFKNLKPSSYVLKYLDNEDDWLYIIDDSDLQALKEYANEKAGKSIKLVIEAEEVLMNSTVEPKRFFESQVKQSDAPQVQDSCVAEVEAFLNQNKGKEEEKEEPEQLQIISESTDMDVEVIEFETKQSQEGAELVEQLKREFEKTNLSETQTESEQERTNLYPVVIEEEKQAYFQHDNDVVIENEEETITTARTNVEMEAVEEPKPELRNFSILECLQNVESVLNDTERDLKPKDVFRAVKESAKGTKAEQNVEKMVKNFKKGKGMIIKKLLKGFFGDKNHADKKHEGVLHRGITCDGCGTRPVKGIRYKCSECPDYDLCQDCEAKDVHNHHVFLKLKTPMGVDIIYSHRTEDAPAQPAPEVNFQTHNPPFAHPQVPHPHPHGPHGQNPWGHFGQGRFGGRHGGHRGGCGRNWQNNNPLMQLAKQFLGGLTNDSSSDSEEREQKPKEERKRCWDLRPVITKKPNEVILGTAGGLQVIETTIQNQSPWPYTLRAVQMLQADAGIEFIPIQTDVLLKHNESQEFCLAVQLPQTAGLYKATFGFFNHKGKNQGEKLTVEFQVVADSE